MHAHALLLVVFINQLHISYCMLPQNKINACILYTFQSGLIILLQGCLLEWKICIYPLDSFLFSAIIICVRICVCACVRMDSVFVYKQHSKCYTIIMDMHPNVVTTRHAYVGHNSGLYNFYILCCGCFANCPHLKTGS